MKNYGPIYLVFRDKARYWWLQIVIFLYPTYI